jgi:hypothetical protein
MVPNYKKLSTNGKVRGGPPYERAHTTLFFRFFGESSLFEINHSLRWGMLHTAAEGETATKDNNKEGVRFFFARVSSLIAKTNITQDPGRDSRWASHSGREDTLRK